MSISQKQAVYEAVTTILTENKVSFEDGQNAAELLTKEMRAEVVALVSQGMMQGEVDIADDKRNEDYIKGYTPSLVSNHLNKDTRLNGGSKYVTKNPGSRAGSGDAQLKALRGLKATLTASNASEKEIAEIDGHIEDRLKAIAAAKPAKVKTVKVNFDDLPEELRARFQPTK